LIEAAIVASVALTLALGANALSPRGLRLDRDYFPNAESPRVIAAGKDATTAVARRLEQRGLHVATLDDVSEWFRNARSGAALVVFVDARSEAPYASGHIPGALPFDHYHPEQSLPAVLPVCLTAQKVVVYCAAGACEDSEFAAMTLRDAGVPAEKIFVFAGGITEWTAHQLLLETGARDSGALR
jgi:rhodanese-related sulfurtransferase